MQTLLLLMGVMIGIGTFVSAVAKDGKKGRRRNRKQESIWKGMNLEEPPQRTSARLNDVARFDNASIWEQTSFAEKGKAINARITDTARIDTKEPASIKARTVLTKREQPMYFRIKEALPDSILLAQVSFQALLDTREQATRNTFNRKYVDFVLCTKEFHAIVIIELDDSSHNGREKEDAAREKMLTNAGYKVLRYREVPDAEQIKIDVRKKIAEKVTAEASL